MLPKCSGPEDLATLNHHLEALEASCGAPIGSIGVVGPTRLEYERLIAVVDYIARLFERTLDGGSTRTL